MFKGAAVFNAPLNAWNVNKLVSANNMFENAAAFNQGLGAWDVGTNNFANVAGVSADYGLLSTYQITDMFKGTTAMSDCNKKAIHNKFEAAPRSLNAWKVQRGTAGADNAFDVATGDNSNWEFPNLRMLGTTKTHVAATELRRSCLAVDVASRRGSYRGYTNK